MKIEELIYETKRRGNKIDSNIFRGLKLPEICNALTDGQDIFVKRIAEPRTTPGGFENGQRSIDDIRELVVNGSTPIPVVKFDDNSYTAELPKNYMFMLSGSVGCVKNGCTKRLPLFFIQHDDLLSHPYSESSFEWEEVNYRFVGNNLRIFTDGTFDVTNVLIDYIKIPNRLYYADGMPGGSYKLPDGTVLTGKSECELASHTHSEIVDLAVLTIAGQLGQANYGLMKDKVENYTN